MNNKEPQRPKQRSAGRRIQRLKDARLLTHLNSAGAGAADQSSGAMNAGGPPNPADRNSEGSGGGGQRHSPTGTPGEHLSYRQQQQLHHRHLERRGGFERLTADLAFLDFNDSEANLFRSHGRTGERRNHSSGRQQSLKAAPRHVAAPAAAAAAAAQVVDEQAEVNSGSEGRGPTTGEQASLQPAQLQQPQPDQQTLAGAYDDQMTVACTSREQEQELAREAQETAEDAALLKKYRICGLLGVGNYARVYRSVPQNGREFAIKAINLSKTSDNYRTRFLPRELIILRKVNHFNICKIYEIHHIADRIFIVMQFCSRGTIADLLHRLGALSEPVSRFLFKPTVDAVVYLHQVDIAHRDLKLENILLDHEYNPKLTDFSYSTHLQPLELPGANKSRGKSMYLAGRGHAAATARAHGNSPTRHHPSMRLNETFCGTLPYLSPEMIRQLPYDSRKTDIWSLGVCLFVMLNDRLPFPFNDVRQMLRKQVARDYRFRVNSEFSEEVREVVAGMLEPEIGTRLSSLELSHHAWMTAGPRERPAPG